MAPGGERSQDRRSSHARGAASDERRLVANISDGDRAAFRKVIDRHLPSVVGVARRILNDGAEAEDVAQDVFLRLWRKSKDLDVPDAGVGPWLRRVCRNLSIDRIRSQRRFNVVAEVPERAEPARQVRDLVEKDVNQRVRDAVSQLPERQRLALNLFHYEGMSLIEVGNVLSVSVDAVESLLARARRTLKRELQNEWRDLLDETDG